MECTYLTVRQVAKRLNLSENYVYRLTKKKDGPLPHTRIGRHIRVCDADLEKWLASRSKKC